MERNIPRTRPREWVVSSPSALGVRIRHSCASPRRRALLRPPLALNRRRQEKADKTSLHPIGSSPYAIRSTTTRASCIRMARSPTTTATMPWASRTTRRHTPPSRTPRSRNEHACCALPQTAISVAHALWPRRRWPLRAQVRAPIRGSPRAAALPRFSSPVSSAMRQSRLTCRRAVIRVESARWSWNTGTHRSHLASGSRTWAYATWYCSDSAFCLCSPPLVWLKDLPPLLLVDWVALVWDFSTCVSR
mmetsp:Transcript_12811/g.32664  ORF Transcript_12811/g.32664 Transcript_12811/m.32664 type:complete len:248 (-) Transcript_12811:1071-1814(-)